MKTNFLRLLNAIFDVNKILNMKRIKVHFVLVMS